VISSLWSSNTHRIETEDEEEDEEEDEGERIRSVRVPSHLPLILESFSL